MTRLIRKGQSVSQCLSFTTVGIHFIGLAWLNFIYASNTVLKIEQFYISSIKGFKWGGTLESIIKLFDLIVKIFDQPYIFPLRHIPVIHDKLL